MSNPPPDPARQRLWLTVMASAMLLFGGSALVDGLSLWRTPTLDTASALESVARASGQIEPAQQVHAAGDAIVARHPRIVRLDVLLTIAVTLLTLYAAAATFLRDRQARRMGLLAGWAGLAIHLVRLPFAVIAARGLTELGAPIVQQFLIQNGKQLPGVSSADLLTASHVALVMIPVVRAGSGLAWPLALLIFFGGRRGRALFGADPPPQPSA